MTRISKKLLLWVIISLIVIILGLIAYMGYNDVPTRVRQLKWANQLTADLQEKVNHYSLRATALKVQTDSEILDLKYKLEVSEHTLEQERLEWETEELTVTGMIETLKLYLLYSTYLETKLKNEGIPYFKFTIDEVALRIVNGELTNNSEQKKWRVFEITGYSLNDPDTIQGTNDVVATGIDMDEYNTRHIPVVAVDPKIIPLYSIVEIEGMGAYIALDTGGMIKGNRIDILFETKQKALEFGRRDLRVRIIN